MTYVLFVVSKCYFFSNSFYSKCNDDRDSQSMVFTTGQKMALRAFYFIRTLTKALTYYYIDRSQRHLLVAIENNRFGGPIIHRCCWTADGSRP